MNANFNTSCCTTYHLSRKLTLSWTHLVCKSIIAVTTFGGRPLLQTTSVKVLYAKQTRFYD